MERILMKKLRRMPEEKRRLKAAVIKVPTEAVLEEITAVSEKTKENIV